MKLLHSDANEGAFCLVHGCVFVVWAVMVAIDPLHKLAVLPAAAFEPHGPLRFLPVEMYEFVLNASTLTAIRIGAVVCCVAAVLRPGALWSKLGACALLTAHQTIVRGFSVMNHAEIVALQAVYVFTAFALVERFTPGDRGSAASTQRASYPLVTLTLLLALAYFFAGLNRFVQGLDWIWDGSALAYCVRESLSARRFSFNFTGVLLERPELLWASNAMFLLTTLAEVLAPLCLVSTLARRIVVPTLLSFHMLALVFMKVIFWPHALLLILFSDISVWASSLSRLTPRRWRGALSAS